MQNTDYEILNDLIRDKYYTTHNIMSYILYWYERDLINTQERNDLVRLLYSTSGLTADQFIKVLKRTKEDYSDDVMLLYTIVPSSNPYDEALSRSFTFDTRHLWAHVDEGVYFNNIDEAKSFIDKILFSPSAVRIMPILIDISEYTSEAVQSRYGKIFVLN